MPKINLSENARTTLEKRYLFPGETPVDLFSRVAEAVANAEKNYGATKEEVDMWSEKFYHLMTSFDFLPNSPTLRYAGSNKKGCLSACLVLPIEDSRQSIFQTLSEAVECQARGLGTGYNFSHLRPCGDEIRSTGGKASGPLSFMRIYDLTLGPIIAQGGFRRGAQMGILNIDHPDIEEFIEVKKKDGMFPSFNFSVGVSDEFMLAVSEDREWQLKYNEKVYKTVKARELWNKIIFGAWFNGEPGVVFLDRMERDNPIKHKLKVEATNPCGEQPLPPYGLCNLGSINLANMYSFRRKGIDWNRLEKIIKLAVRFLDDVIDINYYPLPEIERVAKNARFIGLGVMGWADLLLLLNIKYNSEEAIKLSEEVAEFISIKAREASVDLVKDRGHYDWWVSSDVNPEPIRNAARTTIAPTGSISIIANTSSGIEPNFAWVINRSGQLDGQLSIDYHPLAKDYVVNKKDLPYYFIASHDVETDWHIRMQAAWQKHTDNAISKTINAPKTATLKEVENAYKMAYELGCKGITYYRDGSRQHQVLSVAKKKTEGGKIELPDVMNSKRINMTTPKGKASLFVVLDDDRQPVEFYVNPPVESPETAAVMTAICRLIAVSIQGNKDMDEFVDQLKKANKMYENNSQVLTYITKAIKGSKKSGITALEDLPLEDEDVPVVKCISNIIKAAQGDEDLSLEGYIDVLKETNKKHGNISTILAFLIKAFSKFIEVLNAESGKIVTLKDVCPECKASLILKEGCAVCPNCNYSKCD
jgi:ribonucleoside-diphosphate reductase alpha chain